MENASKALIIAGAIILAVLIIGLGMYIFTTARENIGNTGMDQQAIDAFNQQFAPYEGTNVSGSQVRSLCDKIRSNNAGNPDDGSKQVALKIESTAGDALVETNETTTPEVQITHINAEKAKIKTGNSYTVGFEYGKSGIIVNVCVKLNTAK